jgi:hypothetical protein
MSSMVPTSKKPAKLFTVEEANRMLPLVRAIAADLADLSDSVMDRRHRLNHLTAGRELDDGDVYGDELAEVEKDLQRDTEKLQGYVEELRQLGVEPKGLDGLVDFPSMLDGRVVYLCWKLGEPAILHWHEIDAGFQGRQPLPVGTMSGAGFDSGSSDLN